MFEWTYILIFSVLIKKYINKNARVEVQMIVVYHSGGLYDYITTHMNYIPCIITA